ncbi:MAG: chemotaxis protein CheW [Pseudomonadota bacterium]
MIDTEILQDYSSEARELLDEMDTSLIRLEKEGGSPEVLNNIFRAVHCIKGSAEYIGLERSSTLTHGIENLLDRLREGVAQVTPDVVDFLFRAKDVISTLIAEVAKEHEEKSEISGVMAELDRFLSGSSATSSVLPAAGPPPVTTGVREPAEAPSEESGVAGYPEVPEEGLTVRAGSVPVDAGEAEQGDEAKTADPYTTFPDDPDDIPEGPVPRSRTESPEEDFVPLIEEGQEEGYPSLESGLGYEDEPLHRIVEEEAIEEPMSLEDTVPHILGISLYLDDLQDGLSPEEAFSSTVEKIRLLKKSLEPTADPEIFNILTDMEGHLDALDFSTGDLGYEDVETLRSMLHDLRRYYPEDLFPLEPRRETEAEAPAIPLEEPGQEAPGPPPPVHELDNIPGVEPAVVDAEFASMEQLDRADETTPTRIPGVTRTPARGVSAEAGVETGRPKQTQIIGRPGERSLMADVDDELLEEFEGIFGEPEPVPAESAKAPGGKAADLLEELGSISADADREIMEIFLSYGWEILDKTRPYVERVRQGRIERDDMDNCAELIKSIRSSSTYMDYQSLASFLDEWYEKTLWATERIDSVSVNDLQFMGQSLERFEDFLRGLDAVLNPEADVSSAPAVPPSAPQAEIPTARAAVETVTRVPKPRKEPVIAPAQDDVHFREAPTHELGRTVQPAPKEAVAVSGEPPVPSSAVRAELEPRIPSAADLPQEAALVKTMRVDAGKVDILLNQVGELVVNRSYLEQLSLELKNLQRLLMSVDRVGKNEVAAIKDMTLKMGEASLSLGRVATDIQEGVMKLRMLPVGQLFNRMPRLIRDLSRRVGKVVNLEVYGGDTEVDKRVIEQIYNPLVHLIRNAVDHGIEAPETRRKMGKPEEGFIGLRAYSEGNQVVIDVEDDGGGINTEAVLRKAVENRLVDPQEIKNVSAQEIENFLFMPGFSTSEEVTRTSGRGVGMDVVKKDVEKINGHVEIDFLAGRGTRVSIKIPLTLAIIQTLLIKNGEHVFALPLTSVREIVRISLDEITTIEGFEVIKFREETIPILRINEIFKLKNGGRKREPRFLVLATAGLKSVGFLCEELIGEQDVVIKPLAEHVCEVRGLAGSTILGDGTIALVMDITEIIDDIIFQQRQLAAQASGEMYHPYDDAPRADTAGDR